MVTMGEFSRELCGGTHLDRTGEVVAFEVISEESVSSNTRRIVALTGERAARHRQETQEILARAAAALGVPGGRVAEATRRLVESVRKLKKALTAGGKLPQDLALGQQSSGADDAGELAYEQAQRQLRDASRLLNVSPRDIPQRIESLRRDAASLIEQIEQLTAGGELTADEILADAESVGDALLIVRSIEGANANLMRQWIDQLRKKSERPVAVLLGSPSGDSKVTLVAGLSRALVDRGIKAGDWVGAAARAVGGGGGGRPDLAQAGGKQPAKLPEALQTAADSMRQELSRA
jgi:alanyl-tRNA synthetase